MFCFCFCINIYIYRDVYIYIYLYLYIETHLNIQLPGAKGLGNLAPFFLRFGPAETWRHCLAHEGELLLSKSWAMIGD